MSPETESAAATAVGPGIVTTCTSRARAAATSSAPGSLTAGVPASVTSATSFPVPRKWRMRRSAAAVEWAWKLSSSACDPACASSGLVWRVSSAATAATWRSVAAARGERSSRLPSGVATTYRVPAISPRHRPRQATVVARRLQHVAVLARGLAEDLGRGARHHHLDALEQLERPIRERVRELLRLHHRVRCVRAAWCRQDGDRLVRIHDPRAHLLRPALRLARKFLVHLIDDAPVQLPVGVDERVRRLLRQIGHIGELGRREHGRMPLVLSRAKAAKNAPGCPGSTVRISTGAAHD